MSMAYQNTFSIFNSALYFANYRLYIFVAPPKITDSTPSKYKKQQGATIILFCDVTGTPEPSGLWTKDNIELRSSSRLTISQDKKEVEIRNLQRSDGGTYSCVFTNTIGSISQRIDLIVEGSHFIY